MTIASAVSRRKQTGRSNTLAQLNNTSCPQCWAQLDLELLRESGQGCCPMCGREVTALRLPVEIFNGRNVEENWWTPPEGSQIRVVERTQDFLELDLPLGGAKGGHWKSTLVVTAVLLLVTWFVLPQRWLQWPVILEPSTDVFITGLVLPLLGLVWFCSLIHTFRGVELSRKRTNVRVNRRRVVLRQTLFWWSSEVVSELGPEARADLRLTPRAIGGEDLASRCVEIIGGSQRIALGACQSDFEKRWLVNAINRQLGRFEEDLARNRLPEDAGVVLEETWEPTCAPGSMAYESLQALLRKNEIRIVEMTPEKLVLKRQSGGRAMSVPNRIGLTVFTFLILRFVFHGQFPETSSAWELGLFVVIAGLVWFVGSFLVKTRRIVETVRVETNRVVVEKTRFARQTQVVTALEPTSRARLESSSGEKSSYWVEISGKPRAIFFRFNEMRMEDGLKGVVDAINQLLERAPSRTANLSVGGHSTKIAAPGTCRHCAVPLRVEVLNDISICPQCRVVYRWTAWPAEKVWHLLPEPAPPLRPEQLPADSEIQIETDLPNELVFSYPVASRNLVWIPLLLCGFILVSLAEAGRMLSITISGPVPDAGFWYTPTIVTTCLIGLGLLVHGRFMSPGRVTVRLTPVELDCRWRLGPFGSSSSLSVGALLPCFAILGQTSIRKCRESIDKARQQGRSLEPDGADWPVCRFRTGEQSLQLSMVHTAAMRQQLFSLVSTRLNEWGIDLWRAKSSESQEGG